MFFFFLCTEVWEVTWAVFRPSEGNYLGIYRAEHLQVQSDSGGQVCICTNIPLIHCMVRREKVGIQIPGF